MLKHRLAVAATVIALAAVLVIGMSASAQEPDDLSRLLTDDPSPWSMERQEMAVGDLLELLATAGGFEVYFSQDVQELPPETFSFRDVDVEDVLRAVLNLKHFGLRYRVVGDGTLLVSRSEL